MLRGRRPSAGTVIGLLALFVALGGTAWAHGLIGFNKVKPQARHKLLPYGSHNFAAECDPTGAQHAQCVGTPLNVPGEFGRRALIVADGTFTTAPGGGAGECRIEIDGQPAQRSPVRIGAGTGAHQGSAGAGFGLTAQTAQRTGKHTYSVACNESGGDIQIHDVQLTVLGVR